MKPSLNQTQASKVRSLLNQAATKLSGADGVSSFELDRALVLVSKAALALAQRKTGSL